MDPIINISGTPLARYGSAPVVKTPQQIDAEEQMNRNLSMPKTATNPTGVVVDRTGAIGTLNAAKDAAAKTEEMRKAAMVEADQYAADKRQARIDAINATFAPRIDREKQEGAARMARVDALNFNRGLVGSGADTTTKGEQGGANEKSLQALEDQKLLLINDAFNSADEIAKERAALNVSNSQADAEANVKRYQDLADKALATLKLFGQTGKTLKDIESADPVTVKNLREVSGMSDAQIEALLATSAPAGTFQWDQAKYSGNKMYVPKLTNGKVTIEALDLGFTPNKKIVSTTKLDNGNVIAVFEDGTYSTIGGGTTTSGGSYTTASGKTVTAEADKAVKLYNSIKELTDSTSLSNAVGPLSNRLPTLKGGTADFETYFNNLKSLLTLDNMKLMKGVLSDSDMKVITSAAAPLDLKMSEGAFRRELNKIKTTVESALAKSGLTPADLAPQQAAPTGTLTAPDGSGQVNVADLTPAELKEAQDNGWK